jgi:hypothetical protein
MKKRIFGLILFVFGIWQLHAQDSIAVLNVADSLVQTIDSIDPNKPKELKNILDSLQSPETMRHYFFLNEKVVGTAVFTGNLDESRDLPQLKAIRLRSDKNEPWKFWILITTILLLAVTRSLNVKRFDEILLLAIDMQADYTKYADKTANYFLSNLGLFINFILSLSLFLTTLLQLNHQVETDNYYLFFLKLILVLLAIYAGKFLLNIAIGFIFKVRSLAITTLFNAILVNNLLGAGLVFLNLFFVFVANVQMANVFSAIILITILVGVVYRQIKNLIMSAQTTHIQFIYIFLYLCTLEILPWLVLFKLFLNSW